MAAAGALVLLPVRDLAAARTRADLVTAEQVVRRDHAARLMASGIRSAGRAAVRRPEHRPEQHEILADHSAAQEILAVHLAAREMAVREIRHTPMARGIRLVELAAEAQRAAGLTHLADLTRRRTRIRSIRGQDRIEASRIPRDRDSIAPRLPLLLLDTQHFPVRGPAAHSEELV